MTTLQSVRLLGNESIDQVKDLSTGRHIVAQVNNQYLVKQSSDVDAIEREAVGLYLFGRFSRSVPQLVTRGDDYVVLECLPDAMTATQALAGNVMSMNQLTSFVATFLANVYWQYVNTRSDLRLFPLLSWSHRVRMIVIDFDRFRPSMQRVVDMHRLDMVGRGIQRLQSDWFKPPRTLLHCDIHTDNILVSVRDGYCTMMVIDLEHCMEGPIELEMQNIIFWSDEKSLDAARLRSLLIDEFRIPYDRQLEAELINFYVADQMVLAAQQHDWDKLRIIDQQYQRFLAEV